MNLKIRPATSSSGVRARQFFLSKRHLYLYTLLLEHFKRHQGNNQGHGDNFLCLWSIRPVILVICNWCLPNLKVKSILCFIVLLLVYKSWQEFFLNNFVLPHRCATSNVYSVLSKVPHSESKIYTDSTQVEFEPMIQAFKSWCLYKTT